MVPRTLRRQPYFRQPGAADADPAGSQGIASLLGADVLPGQPGRHPGILQGIRRLLRLVRIAIVTMHRGPYPSGSAMEFHAGVGRRFRAYQTAFFPAGRSGGRAQPLSAERARLVCERARCRRPPRRATPAAGTPPDCQHQRAIDRRRAGPHRGRFRALHCPIITPWANACSSPMAQGSNQPEFVPAGRMTITLLHQQPGKAGEMRRKRASF